MTGSLKKTTFKNISCNALGKVVAFGFQSVANIMLSRELVAEDYGVAGFAVICVAFMKSFSGFGINKAAVRFNDFNERSMSTAFTLRQLMGIVAFVITLLFAQVAQHLIEHKAITAVIRVLAFVILIDGFSLVSTIVLERNLKLSIVSLAETGLAVASSVTAMVLAMNGYKYWSIVYGFVAANIAFTVITYCFVPYKFTFRLDLGIAKRYLRYGSVVFCTGLLSFAIANIDNLIVGSVAGAKELGYYAIAFNWGAMVCSIMGSVVFGILFPTFSRMQDDPARMKQAYLKMIQYTALFSLLCNVGLFCVADNFLVTVLGKGSYKWLPSLPALRILSAYGIIRSLNEPAMSLMMARGNTRTPFMASLLVALIEVTLVYPAIRFGSIAMVASVVLFAYTCQVAIYIPALRKTGGIIVSELWRRMQPAVISGAVTIVCYFSLSGAFQDGLYKLSGSILLITAFYLGIYGLLTRWQVYVEIRDLLPQGRRGIGTC